MAEDAAERARESAANLEQVANNAASMKLETFTRPEIGIEISFEDLAHDLTRRRRSSRRSRPAMAPSIRITCPPRNSSR